MTWHDGLREGEFGQPLAAFSFRRLQIFIMIVSLLLISALQYERLAHFHR